MCTRPTFVLVWRSTQFIYSWKCALTFYLLYSSFTLTYLCWAIVIVKKYLLTLKDSVFMGSRMSACIVAVFYCVFKIPVDLLFVLLDNVHDRHFWVLDISSLLILYFSAYNMDFITFWCACHNLLCHNCSAWYTEWIVLVVPCFIFDVAILAPHCQEGTELFWRKANRCCCLAYSQTKHYSLCLLTYTCHVLSLLWPLVRPISTREDIQTHAWNEICIIGHNLTMLFGQDNPLFSGRWYGFAVGEFHTSCQHLLWVKEKWWVAYHVFGFAVSYNYFSWLSYCNINLLECTRDWFMPYQKRFWIRFVASHVNWHLFLVIWSNFNFTLLGPFSFASLAVLGQIANFIALTTSSNLSRSDFLSWPATASELPRCLRQMSCLILFLLAVDFLFDTKPFGFFNKQRRYMSPGCIFFCHYSFKVVRGSYSWHSLSVALIIATLIESSSSVCIAASSAYCDSSTAIWSPLFWPFLYFVLGKLLSKVNYFDNGLPNVPFLVIVSQIFSRFTFLDGPHLIVCQGLYDERQSLLNYFVSVFLSVTALINSFPLSAVLIVKDHRWKSSPTLP